MTIDKKHLQLPEKPSEGDMVVCHCPQMGPKAPCFYVPVRDVEHAVETTNVLQFYDLFQYDNNIKPDYANLTDLLVYRNGEWESYTDDEGRALDELL